jgi:hypothetical protein
MSKLMKWTEVLKGKGVSVIDNTGTIPVDVSKPMPVRDKDRGAVKNGEVKQTKTIPQPTANGSIVLPAQSEVDAALERSRQAREAVSEPGFDEAEAALHRAQLAEMNAEPPPAPGQVPFEIEPSDPVSFTDLAEMAQAPEIAEENAVVVEVVDKFSTPLSPMQWGDFVTEAQRQTEQSTHERLPDFPPEIPIVYVSLDVPEGVELVVKINGQELL